MTVWDISSSYVVKRKVYGDSFLEPRTTHMRWQQVLVCQGGWRIIGAGPLHQKARAGVDSQQASLCLMVLATLLLFWKHGVHWISMVAIERFLKSLIE